MIQELRKQVVSEADLRQEEVLTAVLKQLELLDFTEVYDCSYRKHLATYSSLKVSLHRSKRRLQSEMALTGYTPIINGLNSTIRRCETRLQQLRFFLYSNPCYKCRTCQERKKQWPTTKYS